MMGSASCDLWGICVYSNGYKEKAASVCSQYKIITVTLYYCIVLYSDTIITMKNTNSTLASKLVTLIDNTFNVENRHFTSLHLQPVPTLLYTSSWRIFSIAICIHFRFFSLVFRYGFLENFSFYVSVQNSFGCIATQNALVIPFQLFP